MGESNGFDFSPPPRPYRGVVSPLGSQYLSMNLISCGMVATRRERGIKRRGGVKSSKRRGEYGDIKVHGSTFDLRLSLPLRIPTIPKPTRNPSRIDCPVVRSPNLSAKNEILFTGRCFQYTHRQDRIARLLPLRLPPPLSPQTHGRTCGCSPQSSPSPPPSHSASPLVCPPPPVLPVSSDSFLSCCRNTIPAASSEPGARSPPGSGDPPSANRALHQWPSPPPTPSLAPGTTGAERLCGSFHFFPCLRRKFGGGECLDLRVLVTLKQVQICCGPQTNYLIPHPQVLDSSLKCPLERRFFPGFRVLLFQDVRRPLPPPNASLYLMT